MLKANFHSRRAAGKHLISLLAEILPGKSAVVLAHGRGAIPIATEICRNMEIDLDFMAGSVVGGSGSSKSVVASVVSVGKPYIYMDTNTLLPNYAKMVMRLSRFEQKRLVKQESMLRRGRPRAELAGKDVIIVDDGTNAGHLHAAVAAVKAKSPATVRLALPFATLYDLDNMRALVSHIVCGQVVDEPEDAHAFYKKDCTLSDLDLRYELWQVWQKVPYPTLSLKHAVDPKPLAASVAKPRTETIPEQEWESFSRSLTEQCFGWRTHIKQIEMADPSSLLTAKPFLSSERTQDEPLIDIAYFKSSNQYLVHFLTEKRPDYLVINAPCNITLLKSGADRKTLRIDTEGSKTFYVQLLRKPVSASYNERSSIFLPRARADKSRSSA